MIYQNANLFKRRCRSFGFQNTEITSTDLQPLCIQLVFLWIRANMLVGGG